MAKKTREKILHHRTVHEVFYCLSSAPDWARLILTEYPDRQYAHFLSWLLEKQFFKSTSDRLSIKNLAKEFDIQTAKATKWIFGIYDDILLLNENKPDLFCRNEYKTTLYMRHYDDNASFTLTLPAIPREFEILTFDFIKAKVGTDTFWVNNIEYIITNGATEIAITLKSGYPNKFREYALDKAEFQGRLDWRDKYDKYDFEIDKELKEIYRR